MKSMNFGPGGLGDFPDLFSNPPGRSPGAGSNGAPKADKEPLQKKKPQPEKKSEPEKKPQPKEDRCNYCSPMVVVFKHFHHSRAPIIHAWLFAHVLKDCFCKVQCDKSRVYSRK